MGGFFSVSCTQDPLDYDHLSFPSFFSNLLPSWDVVGALSVLGMNSKENQYKQWARIDRKGSV